MHERLQRLAAQAGWYEFNKHAYFDINKFAELVIRDVVKAARLTQNVPRDFEWNMLVATYDLELEDD